MLMPNATLEVRAHLNVPVELPNWSDSNQLGRDFADRLIELARDDENPAMFVHGCKAVADASDSNGVQVGFFHRIAERLEAY